LGGLISIFLLIFGLFIIYFVITHAVREGINQSVVGQYLTREQVNNANKPPFIKDVLDRD